ncbi:hypothetical protein PPSIR1_04868 [Plesiocystis pacifica SIR-1]|uniref:Uncharacterized protein n=1 Tax=Plesiocystis pacifica SIR-1 TaxID=391625 RepID=A6FWU6_9BACT|nr:hypothetical protein [Plesiocystis pacifica]EDM81770.1 hypothetical protein PPSIR1_04868 [Plesiocystis pacifica SIR-1]
MDATHTAPDEDLAWVGDFSTTVIVLRGDHAREGNWQALLNRLRRNPRPTVLRILGDAHLGVRRRGELAEALGSKVRVAALVDSERGRGLATALRWLGAEVDIFDHGDVQAAGRHLGLASTKIRNMTSPLIHAGLV